MKQKRPLATDFCGRAGRPDARLKQRLTRIDIAHAHDQVPGEQHLLDRRLATPEPLVEDVDIKTALMAKRLHAKTAEQFGSGLSCLVRRIHHGTKAARIMETQAAAVSDQVKMIMRTRHGQMTRDTRRKSQAAGHAKVNQQQPLIQIKQQVFAASAHCENTAPEQGLRVTAQRPAQGLTHSNRIDHSAGYAVGKTETGDFNFR